ncbi:Ig-like domain repeat protein [Emticicia sp. C21]|uniref:Ig-like domain repeat protein n=1 Tax=Emticicia sp. C21 TaxID=2302915 RepID=UPI000E3561AC|nr:Ig-like domain repeat protein [Emticicia sp. C21]RFS16571.1 Ig-like domain repeat protein [Emticicia sp. C21]
MQFSKISRLFAACTMAVSAMFVLNACKEDEEVFPAPSVSAGTEASGVPGAKVNVTASVSAPAGLKTLTVLKNGAPFDTKTYGGTETSDNYTKEYTIDNLAAGTTVNFTVIATDSKNQSSPATTFTVKVTAVPPKEVVTVKGVLTGNVTWTKNKIYKLSGFVRVGGDTTSATAAGVSTGILTIEPGTVIIGERATKGTLIIQRGSQIVANGTAAEPIVFTSERGVGEREAGDWGGLVICGKAVNNLPGGSAQLEGSYKGWHGGTSDTDNSGSLKYVRVEYAGVPINPNQEINSFTFGSVGSGTVLENLQASFGGDDAYEWFGGTVNAKYLISYRTLDDDFDMDNGYRGSIQFAVALRGGTSADQSGSNGFEVDNDGQGTVNEPFTAPTLSNVSLIGAKQSQETFISTLFQNGMHLRRNNKIKVYNTFVTGFPNGVYIDGSTTAANANSGSLVLNNIILAGVTGWGSNGFGQGAPTLPSGFPVRDINTATPAADLSIGGKKPSEWFAGLTGNKVLASWSTSGINTNVFGTGRPTFTLTATAADALNKGITAPTGLPAFITPTTYVGAFDATDWTATWAEFNPSSVVYIK